MINVIYDEKLNELDIKLLFNRENIAEQIISELLLINKAILNEVELQYLKGLSMEERVEKKNLLKNLIADLLKEHENDACSTVGINN